MFRAELAAEVIVDAERTVGHRHGRVEVIAAAEVEPGPDRSDRVGRVLGTVVIDEEAAAPAHVPLGAEEPVVDAVVGVRGLDVDDLAEQALADHVEQGQVVLAEAPVLEHHAGDARGLVGVDEPPALLEGHGRRHLDRGVLLVLHRADGHGRVPVPRGGDDDGIDVLAPQQPLEILGPLGIALRLGPAGLDDHVPGLGQRVEVDVAEGRELEAGHQQQVREERPAAVAGADDAEADGPGRWFGLLEERRVAPEIGQKGAGGRGAAHLEEFPAVHALGHIDISFKKGDMIPVPHLSTRSLNPHSSR